MQVGGHSVEITRKRIKHLYLRVKAPGTVQVSAPKHWPMLYVRSLVKARQNWIEQQLDKLAQQPTMLAPSYEEGATIYFTGKAYQLRAVATSQRAMVSINDPHITLQLKQPTDLVARERLLDKWYRQQLKQRIEQLLDYWQPIMRVAASDFGVRKMKTRWGSCNIRSKKIWLNFDLIKKAPESLEYVVVHELTHLYERYHNQRFYRLMDEFLPDWRARKHSLNHHE